jgi:hypothetical protein
MVGTLDYVSPEQALGRELDGRSDLYSLGLVLYESLTGCRPFRASGSIEGVLVRLSRSPEPIHRHRPDVPRWLGRWIAKLLERDPASRHRDARHAASDLRRSRGPHSRRQRVTLAFVLTIVSALPLVWATWPRQGHAEESEFREVRQVGEGEERRLEAVATDGSLLWSVAGALPAMSGRAPFVRLGEAQGPLLVLPRRTAGDDGSSFTLVLLEPGTGAVRDQIRLPDIASVFPFTPNRFSLSRVFVDDLDGDGYDEVAVALISVASWPSVTAIWEPRHDRVHFDLAAAGHHEPVGAVDLDGDKTSELVYQGVNSVLGGYRVVAVSRPLLRGAARPALG